MPETVNTDKAGCYVQAIRKLKEEKKLPQNTHHRQVKYLNKRIEGNHRRLKQLIKPTNGFETNENSLRQAKRL